LHVQSAGLLLGIFGPGLGAEGTEQRDQQGEFGSGHDEDFFEL
jgi:hypothetical protein